MRDLHGALRPDPDAWQWGSIHRTEWRHPLAHIADGDLAPLGAPDGQINGADYLVALRIATGELTALPLQFAHGDLHPPGLPDDIIGIPDLLLLLQLVQSAP